MSCKLTNILCLLVLLYALVAHWTPALAAPQREGGSGEDQDAGGEGEEAGDQEGAGSIGYGYYASPYLGSYYSSYPYYHGYGLGYPYYGYYGDYHGYHGHYF